MHPVHKQLLRAPGSLNQLVWPHYIRPVHKLHFQPTTRNEINPNVSGSMAASQSNPKLVPSRMSISARKSMSLPAGSAIFSPSHPQAQGLAPARSAILSPSHPEPQGLAPAGSAIPLPSHPQAEGVAPASEANQTNNSIYGTFPVTNNMRSLTKSWMAEHKWPTSIVTAIHKKESASRNHFKTNANENSAEPSICWMLHHHYNGRSSWSDAKLSLPDRKRKVGEDWADKEHECPYCATEREAGKDTLCFYFIMTNNDETEVVVLPPVSS